MQEWQHQLFIKEVSNSKEVYLLQNKQWFITCESNLEWDNTVDPPSVLCFWSNKTLAKVCQKNHWNDAEIITVPLSEFIESWCVGIENDGHIIGTNFNQNLFWREIQWYDLILELINHLEVTKENLQLHKYKNLGDFKKNVESVISKDI